MVRTANANGEGSRQSSLESRSASTLGTSFKKAENRGGNTGFSKGEKDGHRREKTEMDHSRGSIHGSYSILFFFFFFFLISEVERHGQEWGF